MILLIAEKVEPFLWNNTQGQWEEAALEKGGVDNRWAALAVSNTGDVVLFLKAATGSHVPRSRSLRLPQHRKDFRSRAVLSEDLQQRFGGTRPFSWPITRPRPLAGHSYREGNGADPPPFHPTQVWTDEMERSPDICTGAWKESATRCSGKTWRSQVNHKVRSVITAPSDSFRPVTKVCLNQSCLRLNGAAKATRLLLVCVCACAHVRVCV